MPADIVLGCPTDRSVEYVVHPKIDGKISVLLSGQSQGRTVRVMQGVPVRGKFEGLAPDRDYTYRLEYKPDSGASVASPDFRFHTQRKPGSSFSFIVQGDSHPERTPKMHDPSVYESSMLMAESQKPDFFICLGDDFSVDTLKEFTRGSVESVYRRQVPCLGLIGRSAPVYLVNGNHEQAAKANLNGTADSLGVWAQTTRNNFFAQPAPDNFYSGDREQVDHIGLLRDYYSWSWGDAQFIVIDPYWHSNVAVDNPAGKGPKEGGKRGRDLWQVTLGDDQYHWLRDTLSRSTKPHKFVFAHHVLGTGRGGVELAGLYEWGGQSGNGTNDFASQRPGWNLPIHQLFVKYGVTAFFQGHDHIFCRQELDGVIYQSCPCPSSAEDSLYNDTAYRSGDKVAGNGLVQVQVNSGNVSVKLIRPVPGSLKPKELFSYAIPKKESS
jgi:hypothetical protein